MPWVLEQLFGPNVPENPNYEIIQDISSLVPWWYPHIIAGCTILFLILLWANKRRRTGGQHSSGKSQDMEDRDVRISGWFTDPSRRNQSVDRSIMGHGQNNPASVSRIRSSSDQSDQGATERVTATAGSMSPLPL